MNISEIATFLVSANQNILVMEDTQMKHDDERRTELAEIQGSDGDDTNLFAPYYKSLAERTRKRQWRELASLRVFLSEQGLLVGNLATDAPSWSKMKGDLVWAYVKHLKEQHYTASSITMLLYTIKTYARLAMEANYLPKDEYEQINKIQAPSDTEGEPRRGEKRGKYLDLTDEQVQHLLDQPDTRRGRSDKLLLTLMLLCGFWPREIAALDRHSFNIREGTITFYNYYAEEQHTLHLDPVTLAAATHYLQDQSPYEALFVGNHKASTHTLRLTDRAINARVRALGEKINLKVLAPQDCHTYWEKSLRKRKQKLQPQPFDQVVIDEGHQYATERPPRRKQRPEVFDRRAFEESMRQDEVVDSMLAPFVSDSRLLLPWAVEFIYQQEPVKQGFLRYLQQKLQDYDLKQENLPFYEEALDHLASWMSKELDKYRKSRS
jgi:integrase